MKVKVIRTFSDKYDLTRVYNPGEIVEFEKSRAEDIVFRSLGEFVSETSDELKAESSKEEPKVAEEIKAEPMSEPIPEESSVTEAGVAEEQEPEAASSVESAPKKKGRPRKTE